MQIDRMAALCVLELFVRSICPFGGYRLRSGCSVTKVQVIPEANA